MKRSLFFLELNFVSTFIPGFDPSDELSYQITTPVSIEPKPRSYGTFPWSEELSDEPLC